MRTFVKRGSKTYKKPPMGASLDWNNPYCRNMVDCIIFNEVGSRKINNLVDPRGYGLPSGSECSWENNRQFVGATTTQNNYWSFGNGRTTRYCNNSNKITFRCIFKFNQLINSYHPIFVKYGDPAGTSSKLEFSLLVNSAGNIPQYNLGTNTNRSGFSSLSTNFVVNRIYDLVWVIDGSTLVLYNNGNVLVPSNNFTNNWGNSSGPFDAPASNYPIVFGIDPNEPLTKYSFNTYYLFQSWVDRALTQVEVRELYNNPFNVIAPSKSHTALQNSLAAAVSYYNRRNSVGYGRIGTRTIFY